VAATALKRTPDGLHPRWVTGKRLLTSRLLVSCCPWLPPTLPCLRFAAHSIRPRADRPLRSEQPLTSCMPSSERLATRSWSPSFALLIAGLEMHRYGPLVTVVIPSHILQASSRRPSGPSAMFAATHRIARAGDRHERCVYSPMDYRYGTDRPNPSRNFGKPRLRSPRSPKGRLPKAAAR
jgi:hypothetical protein